MQSPVDILSPLDMKVNLANGAYGHLVAFGYEVTQRHQVTGGHAGQTQAVTHGHQVFSGHEFKPGATHGHQVSSEHPCVGYFLPVRGFSLSALWHFLLLMK